MFLHNGASLHTGAGSNLANNSAPEMDFLELGVLVEAYTAAFCFSCSSENSDVLLFHLSISCPQRNSLSYP